MCDFLDVQLNSGRRLFILDCRRSVSESPFDGITYRQVARFPDSLGLYNILVETCALQSDSPVLVVRNAGLELDNHFFERFASVLSLLDDTSMEWSLVSPSGIELDGNRHSCLYSSQNPSLFWTRAMRPIIDAGLDMFLLSPAQVASLPQARHFAGLPDTSLVQAIILQSYLEGRVSVYAPHLACGISGEELNRNVAVHEELLSAVFGPNLFPTRLETLSGSISLCAPASKQVPQIMANRIDLIEHIRKVVATYCSQFSLSVVTRTQFKRPHLLQRMLASATRARRDDIPMEVILATDIPPSVAHKTVAELRAAFPNIVIRLVFGETTQTPSRVANLMAGIAAAQHRYMAIIDDDDYIAITALAGLTNITFLDDEPLVVMASDVMKETWKETSLGHHVLADQQYVSTYKSSEWSSLFQGVNQLPVCAVVAPATWIRERTRQFTFRHDLSEDYTLNLLTFMAPDLPRIHELNEVLCNISIREDQSNTVTMTNRRPWVRDISNFLSDLLLQNGSVSSGVVQLLNGVSHKVHSPSSSVESTLLTSENAQLKRKILGLQREIRALRTHVGMQTATPLPAAVSEKPQKSMVLSLSTILKKAFKKGPIDVDCSLHLVRGELLRESSRASGQHSQTLSEDNTDINHVRRTATGY